MDRLLFILAVSFGSILVGYLFKAAVARGELGETRQEQLNGVSAKVKILALVLLLPIPIFNSFWKLSLGSTELLAFPFLGVLAFLTGGTAAIVISRMVNMDPSKAASVFVCSMFSNLGIFGGLIGYVLFQDLGFLLVQLYTMFEVFVYYVIGFPLSNQIAKGGGGFRFQLSWIKEKKAAFIPITAIIVGVLLRLTGVPRPEFMDPLAGFLIPGITAMLGVAIGMTLRVSSVWAYRAEVGLIMAVKFLIVPLVVISLGWVLGMGSLMEGVPLKVLVILTFMPSAFLALVPPVLYGFDLEMANSGWLATTLALLPIFPVLYVILM